MTNRELLKTRDEYGANSRIGRRCSNILMLRMNKASLVSIDKQERDLNRLLEPFR